MADRVGRVVWAEFQAPAVSTRVAKVTWTEFEAPQVVSARVGRVTWAEFQTPPAATARVGKVTWVELETPAAGATRVGKVTWVEFQTPQGALGRQVRIFRRIAKARGGRIARLNYKLANVSGEFYNVTESSGISSDLVDSISYEGYEFP
jgi:hypothetical protein